MYKLKLFTFSAEKEGETPRVVGVICMTFATASVAVQKKFEGYKVEFLQYFPTIEDAHKPGVFQIFPPESESA